MHRALLPGSVAPSPLRLAAHSCGGATPGRLLPGWPAFRAAPAVGAWLAWGARHFATPPGASVGGREGVEPPVAVLVRVGDGLWSGVRLNLMDMDRMALLKALKHDEAFSVELRDVPLGKCAVSVCASALKKAPSKEEESAARELEGAETLGNLVGNMCTAARPYLYFRVALPASG